MEIFKKKNRGELIGATVLGFLASFPTAGFLNGFFSGTSDAGLIEQLKGRLFIGCFEAIASATSWGKPWGDDVAEIMNIKFRIFVFIVFIVITFLIFKLIKKLNNKKKS